MHAAFEDEIYASRTRRGVACYGPWDEVDVIGYTSNQSDSESLVSGHSGDSGVGVARGRSRYSSKPTRARFTRV
ncbi:jg15428 [Pararge aegeria aegeria]|uniref:Jg15428 protein n=1 Tax=Pararge aegeria aegeria TaxID=348720 RepID=A0A8S4S7Z9_9NEOP|nr:jg15428 [Pararge aegeria aegeria]